MHDNKVTVLIPTYRRPTILRRAIQSALNQTYKNLQVFVFDDASGDGTKNVVDSLSEKDDRLSYYCQPRNIGTMKNLKSAFKSVNTPYFVSFSDDDVLSFDFCENAVKILDENPDIMFVVLNILSIDQNLRLIGNQDETGELSFYRGADREKKTCGISTWIATLFRKEVLDIYTEMDDRFDIANDMRFFIHLKARYNFARLSKTGAFFSVHHDSISGKRKRFDVVHYAVQMSRYIEVYYDNQVSVESKNQARESIKKMLKKNIFNDCKVFCETLKIVVKNICDDTLDNAYLESELQGAKHAGYYSSMLIYYLAKYKTFRFLIKSIFSNYNYKTKLKKKIYMQKLQSTVYKKHFDWLNEISA